MIRAICSVVLALSALSAVAPLAAQETTRFRPRFGSRGVPSTIAPVISIIGPTADPELTTPDATVDLDGFASDNFGVTSVTWSCTTCTPTSGTAVGTATWNISSVPSSSTIVDDPFSPTGANIDVTTHTAATGGTYTEDIDTTPGGTTYIVMRNAEGAIRPSAGVSDQRIGVKVQAEPVAADYTASIKSLANSSSFKGLRFGIVDASNYCVLGWYTGTVYVTEIVAGVATDRIGPISTTVVSGDVFLIDVSGTALTVKKNGTTIGSGTSTVCDNDTGIGLVWGNVRDPGDNASSSDLLDELTVVDRGGSSAGITLASGANDIVVTAHDADGNTASDTLRVTKSASDTSSPSALITQPTANTTDVVTATAYTVSGTALDNVAVTSVTWTCDNCTTTSGTATLTTPTDWTFALTLGCSGAGTVNHIVVTPHDAAVNTPITDFIDVTCSNADVTDPVVTISSPTSSTTYNAGTSATVNLAGTASDAGGSGLASVRCENALGGTVAASGPTNWSCQDFPINVGDNDIIVRAFDGAGNDGTDTITVTRTANTLTLTTASLPGATQNTAYNPFFCLSSVGGTAPYTYTLQSGTLPTGFTLTAATGCLSGTATATGTSSGLVFRVMDATTAVDDSVSLSIVVSAAGSAGPHDYFTARVASAQTLNSNSFRSQSLINGSRSDSDAGAPVSNLSVTYCTPQPACDSDANRQDAAKVVISAWQRTALIFLAQAVTTTTETKLWLTTISGVGNQTTFKIDSEYMDVVSGTINSTEKSVQVVRHAHGTTAATHALNAGVYRSTNNLADQVYPDIGVWGTGSEDGNTYLFTWDTFHTGSWLKTGISSYKAFQIESTAAGTGGSPTGGNAAQFWFELQTQNDGNVLSNLAPCWNPNVHAYAFNLRVYNNVNTAGQTDWNLTNWNTRHPNVTSASEQVGPMANYYCAKPNEWVRWWVRIEQRANDFDYATVWLQGENDATPTKVIDNLGFSIRVRTSDLTSNMVQFKIEMNTSQSTFNDPGRGGNDLTMYVRNWWLGISPGLASAGAFSDANMAALHVAPVR